MATGPGKYNDLCTYVREQAEADAALIIVLNGKRGTGISEQVVFDIAGLRQWLSKLPNILRYIADTIERDMSD